MYGFEEELDYDGNIPEAFWEVQQYLNYFVEVNYETMLGGCVSSTTKVTKTRIFDAIISKAIDIIRNNQHWKPYQNTSETARKTICGIPVLDDTGKDIFHRYGKFVTPDIEISKTNCAEELAKIDLPYFKELVDLVGLERSCSIKYEKLYFSSPKRRP